MIYLDSASDFLNFVLKRVLTFFTLICLMGFSSLSLAAPVVSFSQPLDGAILPAGSSVSVVVNATNPTGIVDNVRLSLNGNFVRQENNAPYEWSDSVFQNLPDGAYQLTAIAEDGAGQSTVETITITVGESTTGSQLAQCTATSNIALSGVASQSSNFRGTRFPANLAMDGSLGNFTHTDVGQSPAVCALDLAESSVVDLSLIHI